MLPWTGVNNFYKGYRWCHPTTQQSLSYVMMSCKFEQATGETVTLIK